MDAAAAGRPRAHMEVRRTQGARGGYGVSVRDGRTQGTGLVAHRGHIAPGREPRGASTRARRNRAHDRRSEGRRDADVRRVRAARSRPDAADGVGVRAGGGARRSSACGGTRGRRAGPRCRSDRAGAARISIATPSTKMPPSRLRLICARPLPTRGHRTRAAAAWRIAATSSTPASSSTTSSSALRNSVRALVSACDRPTSSAPDEETIASDASASHSGSGSRAGGAALPNARQRCGQRNRAPRHVPHPRRAVAARLPLFGSARLHGSQSRAPPVPPAEMRCRASHVCTHGFFWQRRGPRVGGCTKR